MRTMLGRSAAGASRGKQVARRRIDRRSMALLGGGKIRCEGFYGKKNRVVSLKSRPSAGSLHQHRGGDSAERSPEDWRARSTLAAWRWGPCGGFGLAHSRAGVGSFCTTSRAELLTVKSHRRPAWARLRLLTGPWQSDWVEWWSRGLPPQTAVVRNELMNLKNPKLELISGYPNIKFGRVNSLLLEIGRDGVGNRDGDRFARTG